MNASALSANATVAARRWAMKQQASDEAEQAPRSIGLSADAGLAQE